MCRRGWDYDRSRICSGYEGRKIQGTEVRDTRAVALARDGRPWHRGERARSIAKDCSVPIRIDRLLGDTNSGGPATVVVSKAYVPTIIISLVLLI